MGEPYGTPPLGRGWGWAGNMAHIGWYYGPYWLVIWPILDGTMAHITFRRQPCGQVIGAL